jgi:3-oxoacyl-(acyl-carrier-protein) synthase
VVVVTSGSRQSASPSRSLDPVAVVAAGVVTPIGLELDAFWSGLLAGADGISAIERFSVADLRVGRGAEIKKLPPVALGVRSRA